MTIRVQMLRCGKVSQENFVELTAARYAEFRNMPLESWLLLCYISSKQPDKLGIWESSNE